MLQGGSHKLFITHHNRFDRDFKKDDLFVMLIFEQIGKYLGIDLLPCTFYKDKWDIIGDEFSHMALEEFPRYV